MGKLLGATYCLLLYLATSVLLTKRTTLLPSQVNLLLKDLHYVEDLMDSYTKLRGDYYFNLRLFIRQFRKCVAPTKLSFDKTSVIYLLGSNEAWTHLCTFLVLNVMPCVGSSTNSYKVLEQILAWHLGGESVNDATLNKWLNVAFLTDPRKFDPDLEVTHIVQTRIAMARLLEFIIQINVTGSKTKALYTGGIYPDRRCHYFIHNEDMESAYSIILRGRWHLTIDRALETFEHYHI